MITSPKNNEKIYAKTLAAFQNNIPTVSLPLGANLAGSKQVSTLVQKRQPDLYPIALQNTTFALEIANPKSQITNRKCLYSPSCNGAT
jgi:hypothetical protein